MKSWLYGLIGAGIGLLLWFLTIFLLWNPPCDLVGDVCETNAFYEVSIWILSTLFTPILALQSLSYTAYQFLGIPLVMLYTFIIGFVVGVLVNRK